MLFYLRLWLLDMSHNGTRAGSIADWWVNDKSLPLPIRQKANILFIHIGKQSNGAADWRRKGNATSVLLDTSQCRPSHFNIFSNAETDRLGINWKKCKRNKLEEMQDDQNKDESETSQYLWYSIKTSMGKVIWGEYKSPFRHYTHM